MITGELKNKVDKIWEVFWTGGTEKVWFYDMKVDGLSLDDKRQPVQENDYDLSNDSIISTLRKLIKRKMRELPHEKSDRRMRMTIDSLKKVILSIANKYPIKKVFLFGSRAEKTDHENSDVDLIMEFFAPISLLTLSKIKLELEEILRLKVDIVHGPVRETDLIEIGKVVEVYAA